MYNKNICPFYRKDKGDNMKKFEKFLSKMKDSQEFASDDRLSRLIGKFDDDELSMDELDHIAAAAKPDFFYRNSEQED